MTPDRNPVLVMAAVQGAMCGSVMLFADFMQKRRYETSAKNNPPAR